MNTNQEIFEWSRLVLIHKKTAGLCHLCGREHALDDYGKTWEKEHSLARRLGGTDHLNNLFVACISCNRSKGVQDSRSFRQGNGLRRTPLSSEERIEKRATHALVGAAIGGLGALLFAPEKFWWFVGIGGVTGFAIDPEWNNRL